MNIAIKASIVCFFILNSCKSQQKVTELKIGDTFPTIKAQTLANQKIVFPNDTKGNITVIAAGFAQEVQIPINTWTDFILNNYPSVKYFEVPIGNSIGSLFAKQIDNAMRSGVPKNLHPMTATYYGSLCDTYKKQFGESGKPTCYVFLLDKEGKVVRKFVGPVTKSIEAEFQTGFKSIQ